MQFYKLTGLIENEGAEAQSESKSAQNRARFLAHEATPLFNRDLDGDAFVSLSDTENGTARALVMTAEPRDPEKLVSDYLKSVGLKLSRKVLEEISFKEAKGLLSLADRRDFIDDDEEVLEAFDLNILSGFRADQEFGETVLEPADPEKAREAARSAFSDRTLLPELDRIRRGSRAKVLSGHPVHYLVRTDDPDVRQSICRSLLQTLYAAGRIRSLRYVYTDIDPSDRFSKRWLNCLCKSCRGGTLVIRYICGDESEEAENASADRNTVERLCESIRTYRNEVLTVLCLPRVSEKVRELFREYLGTVSLVELQEDFISGKKARAYLRDRARRQGTNPDRKLYAALEEGQEYLSTDLNRFFDEWYDEKLKRSVYPQYRHCVSAVRQAVRKKADGSAYDELQEMTGLGRAKKVMEEALAYYRAQRLFAEKGMKQEHAAMHMVFTGNPGTAKTTAARLFAKIMRDNGLLAKGQLVEVGRGDLVGKFVGWTAPNVKKKFEQAKGGVLFIDEAYSLVDGRDGMYGDEAINAIVQEMENHRNETVVIFAGYPDKMQSFLEKNPGLRSRIAFHVPFEDYTAQELCGITRFLAKQKKLELTDEAMEKLAKIYEAARSEKDFGNGRFVRNMLEKAQMAQARRLLTMDPEAVTEKDVRTVEAADIEEPVMNLQREERRKIGF